MDKIARLKASQDSAKKKKWRGPRGFPGKDGDAGATGVQGETGSEGLIGPHGLAGEDGQQGIQGIQGEEGAPGLDGLRGEHGRVGDPGLVGPSGPQGDDGIQGLQGNQGDQGLFGKTGERGLQGEDGLDGQGGKDGLKGLDGIMGPQGYKGDQGDPGLIGPKGEKGTKGKDGIEGKIGPTNIISGGPAFMPRNAREQTRDPTPSDDQNVGYLVGSRWWRVDVDKEFVCLDKTPDNAVWKLTTGNGSGGISGPVSSTDNAIVRWDGVGGDTLQDSSITISDTDVLNMALNETINFKMENLGALPGAGTTGRLVYLTTDNHLYLDQG